MYRPFTHFVLLIACLSLIASGCDSDESNTGDGTAGPSDMASDSTAGDAETDAGQDGALDSEASDVNGDSSAPDSSGPDASAPDSSAMDVTTNVDAAADSIADGGQDAQADMTPDTDGGTMTGLLYDLYGTDSSARGLIPFEVNWPAPPQGPLTALTVTDSASLATALSTPNAHITVASGSYGTLALSEDDQHWELADDAVFSGLSFPPSPGYASRIIIDGGVINSSGSLTVLAYDFVMHNVRVNVNDNGSFSLGISAFNGNPGVRAVRHAYVHNTIIAERTGLYVSPGEPGNRNSDLIVAANYIQGGMKVGESGVEAALRIQGTQRYIAVDNRARCGFDGEGIKHTYRSHYGNEDYWMRRNLTEYGDGIFFNATAGSALQSGDELGDHWVYDFRIHTTNLSAYAFRNLQDGDQWFPGVLTVDGNAGYTDLDTNDNWIWSEKSGDSVGSNTSAPYQAAPALGAWLAADGLAPGADH